MRLVRHKTNPFIDTLTIKLKNKREKISVSTIGNDSDIHILNSKTGETRPLSTHVVKTQVVDADMFVKLFADQIGLTFELKAAGIKAFNVLMWSVQTKGLGTDIIPLDRYTLEEFQLNHEKYPSDAVFKRGINELEKAAIVAKSVRAGWYFINPSFCFNGDRIAFTRVIERKQTSDQSDTQLLEHKNDEQGDGNRQQELLNP